MQATTFLKYMLIVPYKGANKSSKTFCLSSLLVLFFMNDQVFKNKPRHRSRKIDGQVGSQSRFSHI